MIDDSLKEIIPEFLDEASAYLDTMNESLLKLEEDIGQGIDTETINNLFRAAHSLKGASGMLGFNRINKVTHRMESVFSCLRDKKLDLSRELVDILLQGLDIINSLVNDLSQNSDENTDIDEIVIQLEDILSKNESVTEEVTEELDIEKLRQELEAEKANKEEPKEEIKEEPKEKKKEKTKKAKTKEKEEDQPPTDEETEKYRKIFLEEVTEDVEKLDQQMLILEGEPDSKDTINEIFRLSHRIKGSFATFGYAEMSTLAHKMEDTLEIVRSGEAKADKYIIDLFLELVDKFKNFIKQISSRDTSKPDIHKHLEMLNQWHDKRELIKEEENKAKTDNTKDKTKDLHLNSPDKTKIEKNLRAGLTAYSVSVNFDKDMILGFERAFLILNNLEEIGEVVKSIPDLETITKDKYISTFVIILATSDTEKNILKACNVDLIESVSIKKINPEDILQKTEKGKEPLQNQTIEKEQVQTSIRVDASRLDHMMNLAGELIIIKSRFSLLSTEFRDLFINKELLYLSDEILFKLGRVSIDLSNAEKDPDEHSLSNIIKTLHAHIQTLTQDFIKLETGIKDILKNKSFMLDLYETTNKLGKVCTGIQTGVMQVRMVPIGPVLKRFNRTVRDVARANGKKIDLKIKGEDTELDKNIIDSLGNPLTHMIRNAADHGIETIEERLAAGKSGTGTINLSAYHEGSFICVEVSDDGKGLDVDRIKTKAIEKELKTEEELTNMTDREIMELVFMPGFSTAKQVSDLSGRGVGMDVVRQKVTEMKGNVTIDSVLGEGSQFVIKLPLTLAILTALLVKVGEEIFCIPLESVEEIVCFGENEIYTVEGTETFKLRGKVLPLLRLDEVFEMPNDGIERKNITIVVINSNGQSAGMAVDTLVGEQEIVIKSLGEEFKDVSGISGASILGDGDLSLILDAGEIIGMTT